MSRHYTTLKAEVTLHVAYGYDKPLQEYFLMVEDISLPLGWNVVQHKHEERDEEKFGKIVFTVEQELVGSLSDVHGSGANLIAKAEILGIPLPGHHLEQAAMDLPIEGDGFTTVATLKGDE